MTAPASTCLVVPHALNAGIDFAHGLNSLTSPVALAALAIGLSGTGALAQATDTLTADFENPSGQTESIDRNLDGAGFNYTNRGRTEVFNGNISNVGTYTNAEDTTAISNGTGPRSLEAGTVVNQADLFINVQGRVTSTAGNITSSGTIRLSNSASLISQGNITLDVGGTLTVRDVTTRPNGAVTITAIGGTVTNAGEMDLLSDTQTNVNGALNTTASGEIDIANDGELNVSDGIQNQGDITSAGTIGADILNDGSITAQGRINGAITNQSNGEINVNAALAGVARLTNNDDAIVRIDGGTLDVVGAIQNNSRMIVDGTVSATTITNTDVLNAEGAFTGNVINTGAGARMTVTGNLTQEGTIEIGNNTFLDVSGGNYTEARSLTNRGTVTLTNNRRFEATTISNQGAGRVTVETDSTLQADTITNGGRITSTGTIAGDLTVNTTGILTASGTIDGDVTSAGASVALGALDVDGDVLISGGTFDVAADADPNTTDRTDVSGTVTNGATLRVNADTELEATDVINQSDGTLTSAGTIDADVSNQGAATLQNRIEGDLNNSGDGVVTLSDDLEVTLDVDNQTAGRIVVGTNTLITRSLTNGSGAEVTSDAGGGLVPPGDIDVAGAIVNAGTITSNGILSGSRLDNSGQVTTGANAATFTGVLDNNSGGTFTQGTGTTTAASITNDGDVVINGGLLDIAGTVTNDGNIDVNSGELEANRLAVDGTGTVDVATGGTLDINTIVNAGRITSLGTLDGVITNNGTLSAAGTVTGNIRNNDTFTVSGPLAATPSINLTNLGTSNINSAFTGLGDITNSGDITVANGVALGAVRFRSTDGTVSLGTGAQLNISGPTFSNTDDGEVALGSNAAINHAGTVRNTGLISVTGSGARINSATNVINNNNGFIDIGATGAGSAALNGDVTNSNGTIRVGRGGSSTVTINGNLNNNNGVVGLIAGRGEAGDRLVVNGNMSSAGTYRFDVDLQSRTADVLTLNGTVTGGQVALEFNLGGQEPGLFGTPITVVNGTGANLANFTYNEAVFDNPLVTYSLQSQGSSLVLANVVDPAIGALSGSFALVQGLIGSVINRPSSPFVSGLAFEDDDPCGSGTWTRALGGSATATGDTNSGGVVLPATVDATFGGLQVGYDFGCFNAASGGWDLAGGGVIGFNAGSTEQENFEFDTQNFVFTDRVESVTRSDFSQTSVGAYVAFARDRFNGDVQLRFDRTEFEFDNPDIDLRGAETTSDSVTLSSSLSYTVPLSDTWTIVPTGGFGLTWSQTDPIAFTDETGQQTGRLNIDDHLTAIGFAGVTVANTTVRPSGDSAFNRFATATVYYDFSDERDTSFTQFDAAGNPIPGEAPFASENLGTFGEVSLGLSYIRILDGQFGSAKQLNASIRLDTRFSERIDAVSLTAQARFQF
ncbi:S-layer family protein [Actibacterium sp. 188UL27-1]|uniref:beta strand repeat-containing protein n=1 Tax=Actibacterium sp. 188UL27-1 TaxID=2786961 RepID=UPI00195857A6|nr:hypothetical protein [Actibacterium sp. 188UL27-1]MBM7068835.1 hypothetical protein [Actibacterium sp. 188UL27-1]